MDKSLERKKDKNRKNEVIEIFRLLNNPSDLILVSTHFITEMSKRNFLGVKGGRCVGHRALPFSCADCQKSCES